MGARFAENGAFYIYTVFVLIYADAARAHGSQHRALGALIVAATIELAAIPLYGALSDRIGRRPVYMFGAVCTALTAYPIFWMLDTGTPWLVHAGALHGPPSRPRRDVRAPGRVLLGAVRHERPIQRRVARRAAVVGHRRGAFAAHRDQAAAARLRARRAVALLDRNGRDHHRVRHPRDGDDASGHPSDQNARRSEVGFGQHDEEPRSSRRRPAGCTSRRSRFRRRSTARCSSRSPRAASATPTCT